MEEFNIGGHKIQFNEDGRATVITKDGRTISMSDTGVNVSGGEIKRIGFLRRMPCHLLTFGFQSRSLRLTLAMRVTGAQV